MQSVVNTDTPTDFDLTSSLLASADLTVTPDDDEGDNSSADDILCETTLRLWHAQAQNPALKYGSRAAAITECPADDSVVFITTRRRWSRRKTGVGCMAMGRFGSIVNWYLFEWWSRHNKWTHTHWTRLGRYARVLYPIPLQPFTILPSGAADRVRFQAQVLALVLVIISLPCSSTHIRGNSKLSGRGCKFISSGGWDWSTFSFSPIY